MGNPEFRVQGLGFVPVLWSKNVLFLSKGIVVFTVQSQAVSGIETCVGKQAPFLRSGSMRLQ